MSLFIVDIHHFASANINIIFHRVPGRQPDGHFKFILSFKDQSFCIAHDGIVIKQRMHSHFSRGREAGHSAVVLLVKESYDLCNSVPQNHPSSGRTNNFSVCFCVLMTSLTLFSFSVSLLSLPPPCFPLFFRHPGGVT